LEIPDPENPDKWKMITIPPIIESKLIIRNIKHFGQASSTPFASAVLQQCFGYDGTNIIATNLIFHQQLPPEFHTQPPFVQELLQRLSDGQRLKSTPLDVTFEEYCKGFRVWRERTSTSPSGRHLGHYKLLLRLPVYDTANPDINISTRLLYLYYQVAMTAAHIGQPLARWCNVSTMMIQKDKQSTKINRLRVIHLYEADYNLILKLSGLTKACIKPTIHNFLMKDKPGVVRVAKPSM
jgi:hypothetical protein